MKKLIKILFVETIQSIENLLNIISSEGTTNSYKVVSSRKEFIDNLIAYSPDIIVTDYEYSGLSIHDTLQIRHEMSPYTPIILITDQKKEKEAVRYITNGSDDYVVKSHLSRLPYTIDTCIAKHNALSFRLNAENELRNMKEQVEMLKRTVEDISIALVAVDKYHSIKIWNRPSEEMLGWTQKEVIGLPYRNFIKIEYIGFDNQKVLTSLHDNGYWNGNAFIWNKKNQKLLMFCRLSALNRDNPDNGEILFEFHKLPYLPKHGTINKTSSEDADKTIILDNYTSEVKERIKINGCLDLVVKTMEMGMLSIDIASEKLTYDERACFLLGIDPNHYLGTKEELYNVIHKDDIDETISLLKYSIKRNKDYETEFRVISKDGSLHHIVLKAHIIFDEDNKPVRLNGLLWEVTDQKLLEIYLRENLRKINSIINNLT